MPADLIMDNDPAVSCHVHEGIFRINSRYRLDYLVLCRVDQDQISVSVFDILVVAVDVIGDRRYDNIAVGQINDAGDTVFQGFGEGLGVGDGVGVA